MTFAKWVEPEIPTADKVPRQLTVLLVEDDPADALIVRRSLGQGRDGKLRLMHVTSLAQAVTVLDRETVDAVLLDLGLPDCVETLQALDVVLAHAPSVPVVVMTGLGDNEIGLEGIRRGAEDFLVKSLATTTILPHVIEYAIERKRLKERLRLSEERLEMALYGANVGVWDWDVRADRFYASPEWRSIMRIDSASPWLQAKDWEAEVHPEDRDAFTAALRDYLNGSAPEFATAYRIKPREGAVTWVHARGQCVRDAAGVPRRMLGAVSDITHLNRHSPYEPRYLAKGSHFGRP